MNQPQVRNDVSRLKLRRMFIVILMVIFIVALCFSVGVIGLQNIRMVKDEPISNGNRSLNTEQIAQSQKDAIPQIKTQQGTGSGIVINQNVVLTNAHVVGNNPIVLLSFDNGDAIQGRVVDVNPQLDLALVKARVPETIRPVTINAKPVNEGAEIVVLGYGLGVFSTTQGIVSGLNRQIEINASPLIQIDAAVNGGNSGGGLFNNQGQLVGVICAKITDKSVDNVGFAIPISTVLEYLDEHKVTANIVE